MNKTPSRGGLYLKSSDLEVLAALAEFRLLQPRHFRALRPRHVVAVRRRLRQLTEHGLVQRLTLPYARPKPIGAPPDEFTYSLARRGAHVLRESCGIDAQYSTERKCSFLEHDLAIANFHVALALAANKSRHLTLTWRQTDLLDSGQCDDGERVSVNPDSLCALTDTRLPSNANTSVFFIELERGRQHSYSGGESAFLRKIRAYHRYAISGACRQSWDIEDFRVLTLVPTAKRAANLRALLIGAGLGFDRFWLSDFESYNLAHPELTLDAIWLSAADDQCHSLLNPVTSWHDTSDSVTTIDQDHCG